MKVPLPLMLLVLAGCAATPTSTTDTPQSIALNFPVAEIRLGDAMQLTATVLNASQVAVPAAKVEWSIDQPAIASISATGFLVALAPGTVVVTARSGGVSATRSLIIRPTQPAAINILPETASLHVSERRSLVADVRAADGYQLVNASVFWSVDRIDVATIDHDGNLSGVATGVVTVTASIGGIVATRQLTVLPATVARVSIIGGNRTVGVGASYQYGAEVYSTFQRVIPGAAVNWSSSNPTVASVTSNGLVTAVGGGTTTITAANSGVMATVTVGVPFTPVGTSTPLRGLVYFRQVGNSTTIEAITEDGDQLLSTPLSTPATIPTFAPRPTLSLSPDGTVIAYDCGTRICKFQVATGVSTPYAVTDVGEPTWLPGGSELLLRGNYSSVVWYNPATGASRTRRAPFYVERPRLSPLNEDVIYQCDFTHLYEDLFSLCRIDANGVETLYKSMAGAFAWAPDGRVVAYLRYLNYDGFTGDDPTQIRLAIEAYQTNGDPSAPSPVEFAGFGDVSEMVWSPDGQKLALVRNGQLWIYSAPNMTNPLHFDGIPGTIWSVNWR
ncbi:MAG: Ig-like domain-containing protein [Gemmatimonadales bacterium]